MPLNADLKRLELSVPTYYGSVAEKLAKELGLPEFGEPVVPVLVHEAEGVRIILGTHDYDDLRKPDIQIERRPNGWAIFLHPEPGGDASGFVYFLDDGRSFVLPEHGPNPIEMLDRGDEPPEIDEVDGPVPDVITQDHPELGRDDIGLAPDVKSCARCVQTKEYSGDWYDVLCPECADRTEGDWVCPTCGRSGSFETMGGDGAANPDCCGTPSEHVDPDEATE
jgi:hypothetical protein